MSDYAAPLADMRFVLHHLCDLQAIAELPGCGNVSPELLDAILEEGGKFAAGVLAPLNQSGDREACRLHAGEVRTASGWKAAYEQFAAAGWTTVGADEAYGGQALPALVSAPLNEMWKAANLAFSLCPMLTNGAIEALLTGASDALKQRFVPRMVSGEWTGTMNLTEPQAGSDLSAVRTRAVPQADGSYRLFGQKIFITYGEHDLTPNIVHLVLARLPDAPEGVKGISLFAVPKFLVNDDGSLGERNDVHCVSLEHKLGIHASPTCVMSYGDQGGALGYLVGEPNRGLEIMFVMMNAARFAVGLEGVAIAERAYQQALSYARERTQGYAIAAKGGARVAIIQHPDVRRMLLLMKTQTEAMRALAYVVAAAVDQARCDAQAQRKQHAQAFVDLMIPIVKAWCTETGVEVASLGVQVHGGMGYIEETGAAQHLRDARITTIYEGTTGIQANDLVSRKILRDGGAAMERLIAQIRDVARTCSEVGAGGFAALGENLDGAAVALQSAVTWLLNTANTQPNWAYASGVPLLRLAGIVCGGWQMCRAALIARQQLEAQQQDQVFLRQKIGAARFYVDHVLCQAHALRHTVVAGGESVFALSDELS